MSEEKPPRRSGVKLAGIAALALLGGALAGAAGIYVMASRPGNLETGLQAANCPAGDAWRAAVDATAKGEVAAVQALDTPFDARAIAFEDADGTRRTLTEFAGRTLLVNLWATWCVPCRLEMPALEALEVAEGGADFAVVPINVDTGGVEKPRAFYAETELVALPFYRDETMGVFNDLKRQGVALGLPATILVDGAGCARAAINGPAEWSSPDAVRMIDAVKGAGPA